jgi:hypothetical protein
VLLLVLLLDAHKMNLVFRCVLPLLEPLSDKG